VEEGEITEEWNKGGIHAHLKKKAVKWKQQTTGQ